MATHQTGMDSSCIEELLLEMINVFGGDGKE